MSKQDAKGLAALGAAVAGGELVIPIRQRLPLKDAAHAHEIVKKRASGKVLRLP